MRTSTQLVFFSLFAMAALLWTRPMNGQDQWVPPKGKGTLRVATFNVSLNRKKPGELIQDLKGEDPQAKQIATIIQTVAPDILLLNEFDFDPEHRGIELFRERYLQRAHGFISDAQPLRYDDYFSSSVNTGVPSGLDLNRNGKLSEPDDCFGFGAFPGQYGMVLLSRFPIQKDQARTFQKLHWSSMPDALRPKQSDGSFFYPDSIWEKLYLSSKSHWDIPIVVGSKTIHLLASHPTPPVFDGEEDRNGCRNHDEIRLWVDYITGGPQGNYIQDDAGRLGTLEGAASFVVLGDLNADPVDGAGRSSAIQQLLQHPRVAQSKAPRSEGGIDASRKQGEANRSHRGAAEQDTADFNDRTSGNLRCDFVLPSNDFDVLASGVFWPVEQKATISRLIDASDHRMVWMDLRLKE